MQSRAPISWDRLARLLVLLWAAARWPAPALADDEVIIRVRAQSQLHLTEEQRTEARHHVQVQVGISLRDGPSQAPLAQEPVLLAVPALGWAVRLVTDSQGQTTLPLPPLKEGRYQVTATFAGDDLRDRAQDTLSLDLLRDRTTLTLQAPERIGLHDDLPVQLALESAAGPLSGQVLVAVARPDRRRDQPMTVAVADGQGATTLQLGGGAGLRSGSTLTVIASFPGTLLHGPALQRAQVLITAQTETTLDPPAPPLGEVAQDAALVVTGQVLNRDEGVPLGGELVEVLARSGAAQGTLSDEDGGDQVLGSGTTDAAGRFRVGLRHVRLPLGPAALMARFLPARRHLLQSRSLPLPLTVLPPEPVPLIYFVVPVSGTLLGLLVYLGWQRRAPMIAALRRLLHRLGPAARRPAPAGSEGAPDQRGLPGVRLAQRSRTSALWPLRAADDFDLDGQIGDAIFGGAVPAAIVSVSVRPAAPGPSLLVHGDEDGRFGVSGLAAGSYEIEVSAAGYLPERFTAVLPHRGELRGIQVGLSPIRARILAAWRQVAAPLVPRRQKLPGVQVAGGEPGRPGDPEEQIQTWTPREVLLHVQQRHAAELSAPLAALTDLLEESYYSGRSSTADMLSQAEELAGLLGGAGQADGQGRA